MLVIITGGAGFIGSHTVDFFLDKGFSVTILDNFSTGREQNFATVKQKVKIVNCDISQKGAWVDEFSGADYVIHLAALADIVPSINNPQQYFNSNVTGTLNVLSAALKNNVKKFVYAASSSCYGIPSTYPTPETAPISPQYPYALTKRMGEELVLHWNKVYGLSCISLRFFNVYGTRSRTSGTYGAMFGVFLAQKLAGKPFTIVGDGKQTRDFTYVTDVARAIFSACISKVENEIFNVGSGKTISVNKITKLLGGKKVFIPKRPGEPQSTFADISKIKKQLGWEPVLNIDDGIQNLLNEIEYWKDAVVWTPESIDVATKDWYHYLRNE